METKIVPHYGVHWDDDGVAHIMQGRGSTNAVGLPRRPPFQVRLPSKQKHCNHQINTAAQVPSDHHWHFFLQLIDDPLVRAMLPIPKKAGGVFYLNDPDDKALTILLLLSKMSSPIYPIVVPVWTMTVDSIIVELQNTNIQPFVVTQMEPKHSELMAKVAKAAVYLPRTMVFSGASDVVVPSNVTRIKTALTTSAYDLTDLMTLPWETLGSVVVRKYMRREWNTSNPRGSHDDTLARPKVGNRA